MRMRSTLVVLIASLLAAVPAPVMATNNHFLPGDAFFSVGLSKEEMQRWSEGGERKEGSHTFTYAMFDGVMYECGHSGHEALEVQGITPEMRQSLAEAHARFAVQLASLHAEEKAKPKNRAKKEQVTEMQLDVVVALIYNKNFDLKKRSLGLKYNEAWDAQGGGNYSGLFKTQKPVLEDWAGAALVAPLAVRERELLQVQALEPAAPTYEGARGSDKPLHIQCDDILIILVGSATYNIGGGGTHCPQLQPIFDREDKARYMIVTPGLIRQFDCEVKENWEVNWKETTIKLPLPPKESQTPKTSGKAALLK